MRAGFTVEIAPETTVSLEILMCLEPEPVGWKRDGDGDVVERSKNRAVRE